MRQFKPCFVSKMMSNYCETASAKPWKPWLLKLDYFSTLWTFCYIRKNPSESMKCQIKVKQEKRRAIILFPLRSYSFHSTVKKKKKNKTRLLFSVNSGSTFNFQQNFPVIVWKGGSVHFENSTGKNHKGSLEMPEIQWRLHSTKLTKSLTSCFCL